MFVATALGAHPTVVASTVLYVLAAAVLLVVPWPGALAAVLPIPYAISAAQFWSVRDEDCERANVCAAVRDRACLDNLRSALRASDENGPLARAVVKHKREVRRSRQHQSGEEDVG